MEMDSQRNMLLIQIIQIAAVISFPRCKFKNFTASATGAAGRLQPPARWLLLLEAAKQVPWLC
jgi:hypothetical protein